MKKHRETLLSSDIIHAKKISKAIQHYLEETNSNGIRSTDVYPYLARQGLVERDYKNGIIFRRFLKKLYNLGVLKQLIPQSKPQEGKFDHMEWWFYKQESEKEIKKVNITDEIKNDKNVKYCYACGAFAAGFNFCSNCGQKLS